MAVAAPVLTPQRVAWRPTIAWRPTVTCRSVAWWLLVAAALLGWFATLRPSTLGGPAGYVIVSGSSMEPVMRTGDLALVHREPVYDVGDVVAYRIPKENVGGGMLVIHRIIGGNGTDGFVLQGDNRDHPDMWRPRTSDVVGSLSLHVPHAGTALFLLRTPLVLATAAALFAFWFVVLREEKSPASATDTANTPTVADDDHGVMSAPSPPAPVRRPQAAAVAARPRRDRSLILAVGIGAAIGLLLGGVARD